jgi:hypothetical protein
MQNYLAYLYLRYDIIYKGKKAYYISNPAERSDPDDSARVLIVLFAKVMAYYDERV